MISLRTVDDIGIFLKKIDAVLLPDQILTALESIDLNDLPETIKKARKIKDKAFSITAGIVSNQKIKASEVINSVSKYIQRKYKWNYTELDHSNFDLRVFIDHRTCYLSVRLTKDSMHHRQYKVTSRIGSLKSTVAAAMVLLATNGKGSKRIVDNFCGSGTILCEALGLGNAVFGGDVEPESVMMTKINLYPC